MKYRLFIYRIILILICSSLILFISTKALIEKLPKEALNYENSDIDCHPIDYKTVYLTFDDGPVYIITNRILDILKAKDVKATFFVVGKEINGREEILNRICKEGHSIGVHTYSHNLKKIYRDEDLFVAEMCKTSMLIKDVTGFSPTALRYPGGSSRRLNNKMLNRLHLIGFKIYDWNVSIGDGLEVNLSSEQLIENSKKCKGGCYRKIILMHSNSNNTNTIKALPKIIDYYRKEGFKFAPITDATPEYYYRIQK